MTGRSDFFFPVSHSKIAVNVPEGLTDSQTTFD